MRLRPATRSFSLERSPLLRRDDARFIEDWEATCGLTSTLYAFDPFGANGVSTLPVNTAAASFSYIERAGIDLDAIGDGLQSYMQIDYVVPQGRIDPTSTQPVQISIGGSAGYNDTVVWGPYRPYDGNLNNLIDARISGKYLSFRAAFNDYRMFTLSGLDISIQDIGMWR